MALGDCRTMIYGNGPFYTHDCDRCHYLGSIVHRTGWTDKRPVLSDLYVCPKGERKVTELVEGDHVSVISRWGSEAPDYASRPIRLGENVDSDFYGLDLAARWADCLRKGGHHPDNQGACHTCGAPV